MRLFKSLVPLYTLVAVLLVGLSAHAQLGRKKSNRAKADKRLIKEMDKTGLKYDIDKDGDVKLILKFSNDKRSQIIYVRSATSEFHGLEIRKVMSPGYKIKKRIPHRILERMLQQNMKTKIGAWSLLGNNKTSLGMFVAQISAEADSDVIKKVIEAVAVTADEFEKEHLSSDDL